MVGLNTHISPSYPIDAPVDVLYGNPRFLFLGATLHLMWVSLSPQMRAMIV